MEDELIADVERHRMAVRNRRQMELEAPDVGPPTREYLEWLDRLDAIDEKYARLLLTMKERKSQRLRNAGAAVAGPWVLTGTARERRI